jgi:hypothetical protein
VHHSDAWGRVCRAPQGCCSAPCAISRPRPPCSCRSMKKQMAVTTFTVHSLRIHGCTELSDVDTRDNLSFQPKKAINTDYLGSVDHLISSNANTEQKFRRLSRTSTSTGNHCSPLSLHLVGQIH